MKIAHISDTHIKNLKHHDEYRTIFNKMYDILRTEKVDAIVHCGDIAHTKTQISPEFVDMAGEFFKNLASIAPTYIILGNHDGNLTNSDRQDIISPIHEAINHSDAYLYKKSGTYSLPREVKGGNRFAIHVFSPFDEDGWKNIKPLQDKINIAQIGRAHV